MKMQYTFLPLILSTLINCSGLEKSEEKKVRGQNLVIAPIQRQSDETLFPFPPTWLKKRAPYPWEAKYIGNHRRITKEFFRCRGNVFSPPIQIQREKDSIYHQDCGGIEMHGLPLKNGEEYIYPILIELLNFLQEKLDRGVVITCGHRCPAHNLYADPSKKGQSSKHLIGAEVDFYVKGFEYDPQPVLDTLFSYYERPMLRTTTLTDAATPSWYNEEVAITLFRAAEGRDFDTDHPYPYISIQVRYDRDTKETVRYSRRRAHHGYMVFSM
ncbi:MAG: hypothetical protein AAGE99_03025 [Chlamydiota bacterium]